MENFNLTSTIMKRVYDSNSCFAIVHWIERNKMRFMRLLLTNVPNIIHAMSCLVWFSSWNKMKNVFPLSLTKWAPSSSSLTKQFTFALLCAFPGPPCIYQITAFWLQIKIKSNDDDAGKVTWSTWSMVHGTGEFQISLFSHLPHFEWLPHTLSGAREKKTKKNIKKTNKRRNCSTT